MCYSLEYQETPSPSHWLPQIPEVSTVTEPGRSIPQKPHQPCRLACSLYRTSTVQRFPSLLFLFFVTGRQITFCGKDYDTSTHINRWFKPRRQAAPCLCHLVFIAFEFLRSGSWYGLEADVCYGDSVCSAKR